jgi:hypothetical protein
MNAKAIATEVKPTAVTLSTRQFGFRRPGGDGCGPEGRMIFSVGLDRFLTAVAVSPTLRTAHRAVAPYHIKVRILSPRQVGYELRWAGSGFSGFKLHLGAMLEALKPARRLLTFR